MEAPVLKRTRTWTGVTVMNDVYRKLQGLKRRKEKAFQMKLSWTKFFSLVLPDLERNADERT